MSDFEEAAGPVLGILIAVLVVVVGGYHYRQHLLRMKAFDFEVGGFVIVCQHQKEIAPRALSMPINAFTFITYRFHGSLDTHAGRMKRRSFPGPPLPRASNPRVF